MRVFRKALVCAGLSMIAAASGCAAAAKPVEPASEAGRPSVVATQLAVDAPPQSDAPPRWRLAFRYPSGRSVPIAERAIAYTPFRDGVALIDLQRRLLLISPDGSQRTLASSSSTSPKLGPSGELYYVARYGTVAELHRLSEAGRDQVIARELSSIGLIAPGADHAVLLVGARNGGVAGMWRVDEGATAARCLTNCELQTGRAWKGGFQPPPGTVAELEAAYLASSDPQSPNALGGER